MSAARTSSIEHGLDPQIHGLSLERVPLHVGHALSGLFDDMPPVGVPFAEVSALLNGYVLLTLGARLPDHNVLREGGCCARASIMREVAAALVRAADLAERPATTPLPAGHQQLVEFAADAIHDASAVQQECRVMGADRDPSAGQSGSGGFATAVADAMSATEGSSYRGLSLTALPNGVHVTGIETFEAHLDRVITAAPAADGFSVMLAVEGQETPLPPEGARSLAAALIAAAQQVDGEKA